MAAEYLVYVAQCGDGTFYTGSTNDLEKRMKRHNAGKGARYTRQRRPVKVAYTEEFNDKGEALRREDEIKRMTRGEKMALIEKG